MIAVTQQTFEAIIAKFETSNEFEKDVEFSYETYSTADGEEIGFVTLHSYRENTYSLKGEAEIMVRDALGLPHTADLGDKAYALESASV